MSIVSSAIVAADALAQKDDLWHPVAIFMPDWAAGITVTTGWTTAIDGAQTSAETRTGAATKPSRTIAYTVQAMGINEVNLLRSVLHRGAMARTPVPLFSDQSILTANATSGTNTLHCATDSRRFFTGARVAIIDMPASTMAPSFEFAVIADAGVGVDVLTLTLPLSSTHLASALVFPVMECDLVPQLSGGAITDDKAVVQFTYRETVGEMTLDPLVALGETPDGFDIYHDRPVFYFEPEWSGASGPSGNQVQIGVFRDSQSSKSGLFNYIETFGSRFRASMSIPALTLDRAGFYELAAFFDAVGGRQRPFIAVSPMSDFELAGLPEAGSTELDLVAVGNILDWSWRTHITLVLADGTAIVREITGFSRADGVDTITVAEAWPTIGSIIRVSSAFLMRFDTDEFHETWKTDEAMTTALPAIELLAEASVDITLPTPPVGGGTAGTGGIIPVIPDTIRVSGRIIDTPLTEADSLPIGMVKTTVMRFVAVALDGSLSYSDDEHTTFITAGPDVYQMTISYGSDWGEAYAWRGPGSGPLHWPPTRKEQWGDPTVPPDEVTDEIIDYKILTWRPFPS